MATLDERLTVKDRDVTAEVMEGEAIIINLTTGVYYSMDGTGGYLWSLVEQGCTVGEIVDALESHYDVERGRAEEDVLAVVEEMEEHGLVETAGGASDRSPDEAPAPPSGGDYHPPTLQVYRDMEELLALDPPMPGLEATGWEDEGDEDGDDG